MKALIVDDEFNCRENLKMILEDYCNEIQGIETAESAKEARQKVIDFNPDIVFLDIKMPKEDGFAFLDSIENRNFSVVFTTAHNEYALQAFKANAFNYLEKPIDIEAVTETIQRIAKNKESHQLLPSVNDIKTLIHETISNKSQTIGIPSSNGYIIIKPEDIIHLEADESYTKVYLTNNRKLMSSKNIKSFEETLDQGKFMRVHKSHIINFSSHLLEFSRNDGNIAIMSDGSKIPVSRRKLSDFLEHINVL